MVLEPENKKRSEIVRVTAQGLKVVCGQDMTDINLEMNVQFPNVQWPEKFASLENVPIQNPVVITTNINARKEVAKLQGKLNISICN